MKSNTNEESTEGFSELTYRQRFAIAEYGYLLSPENAEVVGKMLGNFQEKDVLPFCQANGKKVSGAQEIMPLKKQKLRDIATGFFGWLVFSNTFFLLSAGIFVFGIHIMYIEQFFSFSIITLWLATVIAPLVLIVRKRVWVGTGIVAAVIINIGIWVVVLQDNLQSMMILPFPLGLLFFQS